MDLLDFYDVFKDASIGLWTIYKHNNNFYISGDKQLNDLFNINNFNFNIQQFINLIHTNERLIVENKINDFLINKTEIKISFSILANDMYQTIVFSGKFNNKYKGYIQFNNNNIQDLKFAEIIHEIKNPINSLVGFTNIILNDYSNIIKEKHQKDMKTISSFVVEIINNILDYSKIKYSNLVLDETSFNLKDVVENIYLLLNSQLNQKDIKFNYYIDDHIDNSLIGDKIKLTQVLLNLITNSIKFTNHGFINLTIKSNQIKDETITLSFNIKDSGLGFDNVSHNLFDPFVSIDNGTGLGLYITKKLITLMNGSINYNSKKNYGTTFDFTCDFKLDTIKHLEYEQPSKPNNIKNILVVDDNAINLVVTKQILKYDGFNVDVCNNGEKAIQKATIKNYDVILMDINMPNLDGIETAKILKQNFNLSKPKIIALSGNPKDKLNTFDMDGYLNKPFEVNNFYKILDTLKDFNFAGVEC